MEQLMIYYLNQSSLNHGTQCSHQMVGILWLHDLLAPTLREGSPPRQDRVNSCLIPSHDPADGRHWQAAYFLHPADDGRLPLLHGFALEHFTHRAGKVERTKIRRGEEGTVTNLDLEPATKTLKKLMKQNI